jgi:hypothetical protein
LGNFTKYFPLGISNLSLIALQFFWGIGFFIGPIIVSRVAASHHSYLGYQLFAVFLLLEAFMIMFGNHQKKEYPKKYLT